MNNRKSYAVLAFILFIIEVILALWVRDDFFRPYIGDVLIVVFVYSCARVIIKPYWWLPYLVLVIAFITELAQGLNVLKHLGLDHVQILSILFGSTFDWFDVLLYFIGFIIVLVLTHFETQYSKNT